MENKEKLIAGIALVIVLFISFANSTAIRKNIKRSSKRSKTAMIQLKQTWNQQRGEIKKAFQTAEKNFKTSKENFEVIEGRLDRMEQELLNARGDLLKLKTKIKKGIKKIETKQAPKAKEQVN